MYSERKFKEKLVGAGLTVEKLSENIGINPATLYRKINGKSEFTRIEMQIIQNALHLSREELCAIFFTNQLAYMQERSERDVENPCD